MPYINPTEKLIRLELAKKVVMLIRWPIFQVLRVDYWSINISRQHENICEDAESADKTSSCSMMYFRPCWAAVRVRPRTTRQKRKVRVELYRLLVWAARLYMCINIYPINWQLMKCIYVSVCVCMGEISGQLLILSADAVYCSSIL